LAKRKKRDPLSYEYLLEEKIEAEKRWLEVYKSNTTPAILLGLESPNRSAIDAAIHSSNAIDFKLLKSPYRMLITHKLDVHS
jgi:hypothetical protein